MENILLIILLVLVAAAAAFMCIRKVRRGGGCCGEHAADVRKDHAADRKRSHYSYRTTLGISGMTCDNCARRVENALNRLPDTMAKVSISAHRATVFTKEKPDEKILRHAVREAGYLVTDMNTAE